MDRYLPDEEIAQLGVSEETDRIAQAKRLDHAIDSFDRRFLVYTAGPYRDHRGEYWVQQNIAKAERVAIVLTQMGFAAICPHKNTANLGGSCDEGQSPDIWLEGDLEMLGRCDCLVMLPGWQKSQGACVEHHFARRVGIPVQYWPECVTRMGTFEFAAHLLLRRSRIDLATGVAQFGHGLGARPRKRHPRGTKIDLAWVDEEPNEREQEAPQVQCAAAAERGTSGPCGAPAGRHQRQG